MLMSMLTLGKLAAQEQPQVVEPVAQQEQPAQQELPVVATTSSASGVVLNAENGKPLPGVSLSIAGVSAAMTDDDGRFLLEKAKQGAVVELRMTGFAYKEIVLGAQLSQLVIKLHDETFKSVYRRMNMPFGTGDFSKASASVTAISTKNAYKKTAATSAESLVQDEGLGVNTITRSGMPGAGANMYMRGFSSLNANNQPLILIDGVPYENIAVAPSLIGGNNITPISGMDVKDIDHITVLKDATSIYGSKGANGAILIETAKATEQATKIDVHAYGGLNLEPSTLYPMMNAWQYRSYLSEMLISSGQYTPQEMQQLPDINDEKPYTYVTPGGTETNLVLGNPDYYRYFGHNTNWQKEVFTGSVSQNYYLNIKGGDNIALYALSVGYLNHEGTVKHTDYSRYSTMFNSQLNVVRWFTINANMSFSYSDRQLAYQGYSPNFNPIYVSLVKAPFMAAYKYNEAGLQTPNYEQADDFGVSNPSALVDENVTAENSSYRFFGNMGAVAELGKGFEVAATFGVTFDKARESVFLPKNGLAHSMMPWGEVTNEIKGMVARYMQYYVEAHLSYKNTFDGIHALQANLGGRFQTNSTEGDWISSYNSTSDELHLLGSGLIEYASMSGVIESWRWLSYYVNADYALMNRYFLSLNMALDASSRFGAQADGLKIAGSVFGTFPSLTAAWLVSSEDFMNSIKAIDLLKLRVGYSLSGNDDVENYAARTRYESQYLFGYYGLARANIANPELKWEDNAKLNLGIDLSVLNERLSLSFDYYHNTTSDLLSWQQSQDHYGISQYLVNNGTMTNTGIELGLQGRIVERAVKWDMGINLSHYKNEITSLLSESITQISGGNVLTRVGNPLGVFYGYQTDGVYATSQEAAAAGLNIQHGDGSKTPFAAGDMRFVNQNSDDVIDEKDMVIIGDPNPDIFGSIVNKIQWNRFTLDAVITFCYGNEVYNSLRASVESMTGTENQTIAAANRWSYEGHQTNMPKATWGDPMGNARFSDRWIEDGSYIRLKNLSLSYDIPLHNRYIRGVQIYAAAANLLTFTKYKGYDPEFSAMQSPLYYGIDMGQVPQITSVMVGVKVGL
jgi:TonB-linked SusC/RagA family outer membrane protein